MVVDGVIRRVAPAIFDPSTRGQDRPPYPAPHRRRHL